MFVWSASFLASLPKSEVLSSSNLVFYCCSGRYTKSVPMNVGCVGDIINLVLAQSELEEKNIVCILCRFDGEIYICYKCSRSLFDFLFQELFMVQ